MIQIFKLLGNSGAYIRIEKSLNVVGKTDCSQTTVIIVHSTKSVFDRDRTIQYHFV